MRQYNSATTLPGTPSGMNENKEWTWRVDYHCVAFVIFGRSFFLLQDLLLALGFLLLSHSHLTNEQRERSHMAFSDAFWFS